MSHKLIISIIVGIVIGLGITVIIFAWTNPSADPPGGGGVLYRSNGNIGIGTTSPSAKLSVKGNGTGTSRAFTVSDSENAERFTVLDNGNVCLSGNCRTNWPTGGVTSINAGSGITLSPNPITNTGTISANMSVVQSRVNGICDSNYAIRTINADGTVVCQQVNPLLCVYANKTYSPGAKCSLGQLTCSTSYFCNITCQSNLTWSGCACNLTSSHTCGY